jgi:hypothetical protein
MTREAALLWLDRIAKNKADRLTFLRSNLTQGMPLSGLERGRSASTVPRKATKSPGTSADGCIGTGWLRSS